MGHEPTFNIDHLLPTRSREAWEADDNPLDLHQLHKAYALARKNLCLARRRAHKQIRLQDLPLKVGNRVYRLNMGREHTKTDLKWLPGYRIIEMPSTRTAIIKHTETGIKSRVAVQHLRFADPLSELLYNSNIDVFPGTSKLYFRADDLKDLNWEAVDNLPDLEPLLDERAQEVVRPRVNDLSQQVTVDKDQDSSQLGLPKSLNQNKLLPRDRREHAGSPRN